MRLSRTTKALTATKTTRISGAYSSGDQPPHADWHANSPWLSMPYVPRQFASIDPPPPFPIDSAAIQTLTHWTKRTTPQTETAAATQRLPLTRAPG